jgi:LSD1 subclass zinc finger protein
MCTEAFEVTSGSKEIRCPDCQKKVMVKADV